MSSSGPPVSARGPLVYTRRHHVSARALLHRPEPFVSTRASCVGQRASSVGRGASYVGHGLPFCKRTLVSVMGHPVSARGPPLSVLGPPISVIGSHLSARGPLISTKGPPCRHKGPCATQVSLPIGGSAAPKFHYQSAAIAAMVTPPLEMACWTQFIWYGIRCQRASSRK